MQRGLLASSIAERLCCFQQRLPRFPTIGIKKPRERLWEPFAQQAGATASRCRKLVSALARVDLRGAAAVPSSVSRNLAVQGLRGMAALAVVALHARTGFPEASAWPFDERFGILGVAVFFAISGMLMAELVSRADAWRFLSHRVVRIYPLFLLIVATWAVVARAFGAQGIGFHLLSLTLAPVGHRYYYLGPEWTLVYECSYYVALFALVWAGLQRYLVPIACAWLVAIALASLVPGWDAISMPVGPVILFKAPSVAFAGGLLVPTLARRAPIGFSALAVAACFLFWPENLAAQYWVAGAAATFVVLDVSRLRVSAPGLNKLGDWSYALYLCHLPVFLLALKLAPDAKLLIGLVGAFGAAAVFGTIDVWLYTRLKKKIDRLSDETRKRSMLWYLVVFCAAMPAALLIH
jgi:exopolysaccharide production protein ExoZ